MNPPKELKSILITQVNLENIKAISVHTTIDGLLESVSHQELYEIPGKDGKCPRLFYAKKGKQWTVHGLSWELSQYLKMIPSKSTSDEVPALDSKESKEDKSTKTEELTEVSEEKKEVNLTDPDIE